MDRVLWTGDIVDYNPWPLESICLIQAQIVASVLGNHDHDSVLGTPIGYNQYAEISCLWTHRQLTQEAKRYLLSLPEKIKMEIEGKNLHLPRQSNRFDR